MNRLADWLLIPIAGAILALLVFIPYVMILDLIGPETVPYGCVIGIALCMAFLAYTLVSKKWRNG